MSPDQERDERQLARSHDLRPVPDPTALTNELVSTAVASLRAEIRALIDGQVEITNTRLSGMDKAVELLQAARDRIPAEIRGRCDDLKELLLEKFDSIAVQFRERDVRIEQARDAVKAALDTTSRDSKLAIDAALQAAKEAVGKSETSTIKQIDAQGLRIDDLKERITRIEGEGRGQLAAKTTQETSNTSQLGWVGLILGTIIGLGALLVAFLKA